MFLYESILYLVLYSKKQKTENSDAVKIFQELMKLPIYQKRLFSAALEHATKKSAPKTKVF